MGKMLVAQTSNIVYLWTVICLRRHSLLYRLSMSSSNQKQCVVVIVYCTQLFKGTYLCIAWFNRHEKYVFHIYTSVWLRMWSLVLIALDKHILLYAYKYNCTNQQPTANCRRRTGWRLYNPPKFCFRVYNNNDVFQGKQWADFNEHIFYLYIGQQCTFREKHNKHIFAVKRS